MQVTVEMPNQVAQKWDETPNAVTHHSLATLATLGKVPPIRDRIERAFVKQSVKRGLDHSPNHFVNWPLAGLIGIVRIPLSPPVFTREWYPRLFQVLPEHFHFWDAVDQYRSSALRSGGFCCCNALAGGSLNKGK